MNPFAEFRQRIAAAVAELAREGALPQNLDLSGLTVEPPRDAAHGDIATNAALVLAKQAGMKPRDIAEKLAPVLGADADVTSAEIAGPGFVNLRLADGFWYARLAEILTAGVAYGDSTIGAAAKVNVEYVSANPTGPMHIGHCRGAVFGDALGNLLAKGGFDVCREYYINDAGAQVDVLARSAYLRYREALGEDIGAIPEGLYPGDYLKPVGAKIAARDGAHWRGKPEAAWLATFRAFAVDAMMDLIRDDLAALGIRQDVFTSELALHRDGKVQEAIDALSAKGLIYRGVLDPPKGKKPDDWEPREQLLFKSTQFGDDVDRPLQKSDGSWTYFASDIAYHRDKVRRGFNNLIDVWGADHGGHIRRMSAAVKALSDGKAALDVKICQLVNLLDRGQPVKMSKRSGTFVTLRELVDEVGKDVVRFIMLTRKNDAPLDFDYAKVVEQSKDNPVFYVQYAHARAHSVLRNAAAEMPGEDLSAAALARADLARLGHPAELALVRQMANWPRTVESAAESHEPHRVAFYLYDLASSFHGLWNLGKEQASLRFIVAGDAELTRARLALNRALATVIASGLAVIGVRPVEEMR
ncbi:MAG TPA: arginine--tRNA ligase [Candidatus Cybelea sp.]|nr:arginine--tRNA ligase [Candidatus Cybelea sp.]